MQILTNVLQVSDITTLKEMAKKKTNPNNVRKHYLGWILITEDKENSI